MRLWVCLAACVAVLCLAAMPLAAIALPLSADKGIADEPENLPAPLEALRAISLAEFEGSGIPLNALPSSGPQAADQLLPQISEISEIFEIALNPAHHEYQRGSASWYGSRFNNRRTASGERFNMNALTAAHRTLPFNTIVRLRSIFNGYEVDVRINDRGPFGKNHVIDISRAAAKALGMLGNGVHDVILMVKESTPALTNTIAPILKLE